MKRTQAWPGPGTVVSVPAYIIFRHKGIVSDRWHGGKPMVISNSARAGTVAEEPWDVFTSGQPWINEGRPADISALEVLTRARSAMRLAYNPFSWNCETFVAHCYDLPHRSPQLVAVLVISVVALLLAARSS
jgi:hypothetical protein